MRTLSESDGINGIGRALLGSRGIIVVFVFVFVVMVCWAQFSLDLRSQQRYGYRYRYRYIAPPSVDVGNPRRWKGESWSSIRTRNYFDLASLDYFETTSDLPPLDVMRTYIEEHSESTLRKEWDRCREAAGGGEVPPSPLPNHKGGGGGGGGGGKNDDDGINASVDAVIFCPPLTNRKFMVGVYSCPSEAGNRLHRFMNALLWAINTNRTFLWRYYDHETCLQYARFGPPDSDEARRECQFYVHDTQGRCDGLLTLDRWVPPFDEWDRRLHFPDAVVANGVDRSDNWTQPYDQPDSPPLIRVGRMFKSDPGFHLQNEWKRRTWLRETSNQNRSRDLMSSGYYFTYGMIFESLFTLRPHLWPDPSLVADPWTSQTVFLHARHPTDTDDGSNTLPHQRCLADVLSNRTASLPCRVYLMSDRELSLRLLSEEIRELQCEAVVADHRTAETNLTAEHGPFAGTGYFQDLALAINARFGFVSYHKFPRSIIRTSSSLIRSIIEFRRILEAESSWDDLPDMRGCVHWRG